MPSNNGLNLLKTMREIEQQETMHINGHYIFTLETLD
jgi:hypothetical protein